MKISYKKLSPNLVKEDFPKQDITTNFKSIDTSFNELSNYLQYNGVIIASSIELTNGYRSKFNVILPTTIEFLALDIDETTLDIDYIDEMLRDNELNHILVATSKPENAYKYRLFLQTNPTTINSEDEYKSLFENIPSYISYDTNCKDIARCFFIYENSAYTIKEYFNGNPLQIKASLSPKCRPKPLSEAKWFSNNKGFKQYKATNLSFDLKNRIYLCAKNKSWYCYELIRCNPVLLNEENIYKLLKALARKYPDKIRLSDTERLKYSIRPNEKVCSGGFYFSKETNCIMFKDLGRSKENQHTCDVIDFCAKLVFGKTDKQSRDKICAGLMKKFKISEINPYNS